MSVSPIRQARKSTTRNRSQKSAKQGWMKRMLRLEALEQRQLMAGDLMPFHNAIVAADVNGDFSISPLDALVVINRLNSQGSGSLAGQTPTDINSFVDTDNDNSLSPLDALVVINAINNGEGVGETAQVRYKFFSVNADGTAGTELPDPNPNDGIPEATIGTGERIIVRTQMADLRDTPQGVFSAYHDLSYTNTDGSTAEKLEFQWGEYNQIDIGNTVRGGTFTIKYGTQTTADIAPAFFISGTGARIYDAAGTATNIRNALQALSSIGTGNVTVRTLTNASTSRFGVNFVGSLAHTDVPNVLEVGTNNLVDGSNVGISLVIGQNSADPSLDLVATVARNSNLNNDFNDGTGVQAGVKYINGLDGRLLPAVAGSATRTITLMGGFSNKNSLNPQFEAANFVNVVDTLFKGSSVGRIALAANTSPPPAAGSTGNNLGIALYGGLAQYLTSNVVLLGTGFININDKLTANADSTSVAEDSGQTIVNVVANDLNAVGPKADIQVTGVTQPSVGGTVAVNGTTNISFTPAPDYFGPVTFTYTIRNNATPPDTATGTVSINVTSVNDAPRVIGTQFSVAEDVTTPLVITAAQIFSPGPANESTETITLSALGTTPNGTVSIVGNSINFTPAANFFGNAIFTVTGTDNGTPASSTVATITVNVTPVNDAPVPFSGTLTVAEDGSLVLIGAGAGTDILTSSNPGPNEASTQTVRLISIQSPTAQAGTITTVGGVTTYRPAANFFGTDTFTYTISDNATPTEATAVGTVTINVTGVNDAPTAVNDTGESARFVVLGINVANSLAVMRNDSAGPFETNDTINIVSVTTPTIGTATVNAAGTAVLFTPPTGSFNTTSTFSYTIRDSGGLTSTANVEVLIIPPVLPFALTDTASIPEDSSAFTIDVIANDFANAGATKDLLTFGQPAAGTGTVVLNDNGTATNFSDDKLVYTPPANFFGDAVFTYTMNDTNAGSVASTGTVTITVTPVNDAPSAADRTAVTNEDEILGVPGATITAGLSKGPGEDAQTLTVTNAVNQTPNSGTVAIVNGDIVYTPAPNFNGTVLVLYTVTDNGVNNTTPAPLSATATLTITVSAVNDPPISVADAAVSTPENQAVTIATSTLTNNDQPGPANESSQTVSFVPFSGTIATAKGGTVALVGTNLVYTPATSFNGADSFTYQISDGQATNSTATATLAVNVTEVNDAPTAATLIRSVFASVPTVFDLSADLATMPKGPANESGQTLRVSRIIRDATTTGTIVLNANGTITYTAPLGASGRDTFRYEIIDNGTTNGVADPKTSIGTFNVDISPFIPSKIHGTVYVDDNNSGVIEANELRLGGVEVTLFVPATAATPARVLTKQTHADGTYSFDLLPPGTYTVSYAIPAFTVDSPSPNSFTQTIVAPGNIDAEFNFSVVGMQQGYAAVLDNLASSYFTANGITTRNQGMYAAIGVNGRSEWTAALEGYQADTFQEVVLSSDSRTAFVTAVRGPSHEVFTATLDRRQFIVVQGANSGQLVRVVARSSDLVWQQVSLAAPPIDISIRARAYLDSVDELFQQEGW